MIKRHRYIGFHYILVDVLNGLAWRLYYNNNRKYLLLVRVNKGVLLWFCDEIRQLSGLTSVDSEPLHSIDEIILP